MRIQVKVSEKEFNQLKEAASKKGFEDVYEFIRHEVMMMEHKKIVAKPKMKLITIGIPFIKHNFYNMLSRDLKIPISKIITKYIIWPTIHDHSTKD